MNIFSSGWLQRMADKAGNSPASRIDSLFQILHDWMEVPGMRRQLEDALLDEASQRVLKAYLLQLMRASGVTDPEMVTDQVHMVLLGALNEAIRHSNTGALLHAGKATLVLVNAQVPSLSIDRSKYAIAVSVMLMAGSLAWALTHEPKPEFVTEKSIQMVRIPPASPSPYQVAALYHLHEKTRAANCSYPQALMLPSEQRAPFIEKVVNGNVGDMQPSSIITVNQLYQKVDCYYPPAAMLL